MEKKEYVMVSDGYPKLFFHPLRDCLAVLFTLENGKTLYRKFK